MHRWTLVLLTAGLALPATASAVPDPVPNSAYVRVNQVGYPSSASKTAYLMASGPENGATFSVRDASGSVVYTGSLGAKQPRWSTRYPYVYALDLSPASAPGDYSIAVDGPIDAASPTFRIDAGAAVYAGPLANALSFYQDERDGPDFIPSALRTRAGPPERRPRDDLRDADGGRRLDRRRPHPARHADRRQRRLVGRRRLPEVPADHELHRRHAAGRRARLPRR